MTCTDIQEQIVAYLDGETPPEAAAEIEAHLAACAACREDSESLKAVGVLARSEPILEPSHAWDLGLERKLAAARWSLLTDEMGRLRRITEELAARLQRMEQAETQREAENQLMTVEEVAGYLRITPEKVYTILDDLPHIEMNYEVRFRRSSVEAWLRLHETRPSSDGSLWEDWITGSRPWLSS